MASLPLPSDITVEAFDALHDQPLAWHGVMSSIAVDFGAQSVQPRTDGSVLVALLGQERVLKLYPPFLRDHFDYECAALQALAGRLSLPTPELIAVGERDGWPFLLMTQLRGHVLMPL
jgi:hygromycin-B 7''-O-kinase